MVDMLSSLLLLKMVLSGFVIVWFRLEARLGFFCLERWCGWTRSRSSTVYAANYVAQLMTWLELSVFLGFSIPLLLPLLAMAVYASTCELEILAFQPTVVFEGVDEVRMGPMPFVLFGGLLMNGMLTFVFLDSWLHGGTLVLGVACICSTGCVWVYTATRYFDVKNFVDVWQHYLLCYWCPCASQQRLKVAQLRRRTSEVEMAFQEENEGGFEYQAL